MISCKLFMVSCLTVRDLGIHAYLNLSKTLLFRLRFGRACLVLTSTVVTAVLVSKYCMVHAIMIHSFMIQLNLGRATLGEINSTAKRGNCIRGSARGYTVNRSFA